jgi:hypothetical protein
LQYDPEGFGEIPWDDFLEVLNNPEFIAEVDANKRDMLLERAQERSTTAITFQDFVNVVSECYLCILLAWPELPKFLLHFGRFSRDQTALNPRKCQSSLWKTICVHYISQSSNP